MRKGLEIDEGLMKSATIYPDSSGRAESIQQGVFLLADGQKENTVSHTDPSG